MFSPKPPPEATKAPVADKRLAVGTVVAGKYVVERELAAGGVGTVVLAAHLELGHKVAIKYLHSRLLRDRAIVERFKREARLVASLRSEHVVRVHDVGALEDGTPYMVMEYLEGEDLGAIVARGAAPIASAIEWIMQACHALAEAHAVGIVHRDLKPENLFLARRDGGTAVVKIVDFGISKVAASSRKNLALARMTLEGERFGTPLYMSPEQLVSSAGVDGRSDIWALGVVLYELLTAELPFHGPDLPSILSSVLTSTPLSVRMLRSEVSPELEALVSSCLSRDVTRRPASVAELALKLASIGADVERRASEGAVGTGHAPAEPLTTRQAAETAFGIPPTPPLAWEPLRIAPVATVIDAPKLRRSPFLAVTLGAALSLAVMMTGLLAWRGAGARQASRLAAVEAPSEAIPTSMVATAASSAPSTPAPAPIVPPVDDGRAGRVQATSGTDAGAPRVRARPRPVASAPGRAAVRSAELDEGAINLRR